MNNNRARASFPPAAFETTLAPHQDELARWHAAASPVDAATLLESVRTLGIIVPHADDETLGCGGLMMAAATLGIAITVTILTDGAASHPGSQEWPPDRLANRRQAEAREAVGLLAPDAALRFFAAPDGALDGTDGLADRIEAADIFVTCWRDDPHPDHRAAFAIARAAARLHGAPLLAFPLWVLTTDTAVPPLPVLRLDIASYAGHKRVALAQHRSQLGELVDDVDGFILTPELQQLFVRDDEMFVRIEPANYR